MKLYTRSGDDGTTGLFGGRRASKDHPRIGAYGTIDELNAALGLAAAAVHAAAISSALATRIAAMLAELQSRLFDIGADLATPPDSAHESKVRRIKTRDVAEIESWIDEIDGGNDPIGQFILPGGTELASRLHVARTVCRRAERAMVALSHAEPVTPEAIVLVNRLSDLLFALARRANKAAGVADIAWRQAKDSSQSDRA